MLILLQGMQIRKASQCQPGHSVDSVYSSHERTQSKKKKKKNTISRSLPRQQKNTIVFKGLRNHSGSFCILHNSTSNIYYKYYYVFLFLVVI